MIIIAINHSSERLLHKVLKLIRLADDLSFKTNDTDLHLQMGRYNILNLIYIALHYFRASNYTALHFALFCTLPYVFLYFTL